MLDVLVEVFHGLGVLDRVTERGKRPTPRMRWCTADCTI